MRMVEHYEVAGELMGRTQLLQLVRFGASLVGEESELQMMAEAFVGLVAAAVVGWSGIAPAIGLVAAAVVGWSGIAPVWPKQPG